MSIAVVFNFLLCLTTTLCLSTTQHDLDSPSFNNPSMPPAKTITQFYSGVTRELTSPAAHFGFGGPLQISNAANIGASTETISRASPTEGSSVIALCIISGARLYEIKKRSKQNVWKKRAASKPEQKRRVKTRLKKEAILHVPMTALQEDSKWR